MAILTISIQRTTAANNKRGRVAIIVKSSSAVLAEHSESFPLNTGEAYILDVLLERLNEMVRELAVKQIPNNFSFDVDSEQIIKRRLFNL